jgi:hypothetical protein
MLNDINGSPTTGWWKRVHDLRHAAVLFSSRAVKIITIYVMLNGMDM